MRIFLDGADGTGKSTLADKLSNLLKIDKFCLTEKSSKTINRYTHLLNVNDVIHDRTFLSEVVYPKYFGRKEWMSDVDVNFLVNKYKEKGLIIILTAPNSVIKKRLLTRGREYSFILENIDKINMEYRELAYKHNLMLIDTSMNFDQIVWMIERRLKHDRY